MRGLVLLILIYLLVAIPAQLIAMPIAVGLIALVSAAIVFLASFNAGYIPKIPLVSPILIWLGARSYGTYLLHVFAYRVSYEIWHRYAEMNERVLDGRFTLRLVLTAALLTIILAQLNYKLIETPLRKKGVLLARARLATAETENTSANAKQSLPQ
jgi:peptidoglycan/LPS O-acetylase OafA/YrhL